MINLRLFFPEIFRELFREMPIKNFLWLDSDLIVLQDLSNLFEECRSRPEQSIIGADLDYSSHVCEEDELQNISSDSDECISSGFNFRYIQGETTINTGQKYYSKEDIKNALQNISRGQDILREKLGDYMPSGGVVFWSIQKIIEECIEQRVNVFQKAMKPQGDNGSNQDDNDNNTQIAYATEEYVFQLYLANSTLDDIYFFPIIYNITVDSCGVFFEFKKNHRYLQKKMFIFHWDSIEKPWGSEKLRGLGEEEDATDSFLDKQNEKWWEFAVKTEFYTEEKKVKQDQFELASV
jgi:lipopolysaccharide biosynthesis glycosyltransferase